MTQLELIEHLKSCGCIIIREDNAGYYVVRNVINGKMSGVPKAAELSGQLKPATVCRICKTLDVEIPKEAAKASEIVDFIHDHSETLKRKSD